MSRSARGVMGLAAVALVLSMALSLASGAVAVPLASVARIVLSALGLSSLVGAHAPVEPHHEAVVLALRLPRVLQGALAGGTLAIAGAALQGVFRNPLVDPALLGTSGGAAVGASFVLVLGGLLPPALLATLGPFAAPLGAFAGGLAATSVVLGLGRVEGRTSIALVLLAGIAVNALTGAGTGLLAYVATDAELRNVTRWLLGSLAQSSWRGLEGALVPFALPLALLPLLARSLDVLALGEAEAHHLGVRVERTKRAALALAALGVGASVATCGVLAFVGLVVPHVARLLVGARHASVLGLSTLLGALLVVVADLAARTLFAPRELPVGVLTAALGAPFFLSLLLRSRREHGGLP